MIYLKMPDGKEYSIEHTGKIAATISPAPTDIPYGNIFFKGGVGRYITMMVFPYKKIKLKTNDEARNSEVMSVFANIPLEPDADVSYAVYPKTPEAGTWPY